MIRERKPKTVAILGTLDSKGQEHLFLKEAILGRGLKAMLINIGTKGVPSFPPDLDLGARGDVPREQAVSQVVQRATAEVLALQGKGLISGIISCGGGTGTHMATSVMRALPLGFPKVMVSTVVSRDLSSIVSTSDITLIHSVADLMGINSVTGRILDQAAAAICGMVHSMWRAPKRRARIALTSFGFITQAAQWARSSLERKGYEVVAFHANGTGGRAMEEMALRRCFEGVLDLALHELADEMLGGYCRGAWSARLGSLGGGHVPRLVVPGGLDCAVLEFTKESVPAQHRDRKLFFYDFRSAIGLNPEESARLGEEVARRLNSYHGPVQILIPALGWSEADGPGKPLYDPTSREAFLDALKRDLSRPIPIKRVQAHINEKRFVKLAVRAMEELLEGVRS